MPTYVKNTWKKKIDPAFDKPVRKYVAFLGKLDGSHREGRFDFPDDFIEAIIENLDGNSLYKGEFSEDSFKYLKTASLNDDDSTIPLLHVLKSLEKPQNTIALCLPLIDSLPEEESQDFYTKELERFSRKPALNLLELHDKDSTDCFSVILSLLMRYGFTRIETEAVNTTKEDIESFAESKAMITILQFALYARSQIAHQKTLDDLLDKFGKGDDSSLCKAVTIDKSLLSTDSVKKRILIAQLSGDIEFFKKLGKAISDNPLHRVGQHGKTYAVLSLFWLAGLYKLTAPELHSFLESCGLIPPTLDGGAFYKFRSRHIKPLFKE